MALLTAQQISQAGLEPVYSTPTAGGDQLANTSIEFFHVRNEGAVAMTATLVPYVTTYEDASLGQLVKESAVLNLAAGEEGFLGPFEIAAFSSTEGNITITCSAQTSVKLAALYL